MPIDIVHVSDIHFGSGEGHGRLNPSTGLNVRFEDFVRALSTVVDYCVERSVNIFLFSGDAYRNASPEPLTKSKNAWKVAGTRCLLSVVEESALRMLPMSSSTPSSSSAR